MPDTMKLTARSALTLLCLAGLVLSALSTKNHYSSAASSYCDLDATFNCDLVNRSAYSELFGIPVAILGFAGYALFLGLTWVRQTRTVLFLRLALSCGGLFFALYLAYVEEHILRTWCILCLGSLAAILGITLLSIHAFTTTRCSRQYEPHE